MTERQRMTPEEVDQARVQLLKALTRHVGPENKIGMGELHERVFGRPVRGSRINGSRLLRKLITELRREGTAVMSDTTTAAGGYWLAASASEVETWSKRARARAVGTLSRIAKIRRISLPEYLGQLRLELEVDHDGQG